MTNTNPKNIAFFIFYLGGGGAEKMAITIMNHLAKSGHKITCFTFDAQQEDIQKLPKSATHVDLNAGESPLLKDKKTPENIVSKFLSRIKQIMIMRKHIKQLNPDVVISFLFVTNILIILATLGLHCKTIISERNDPAQQSEGVFWDTLRKWFYKHADIVTANSRNAIETLRNFVPEDKLVFTPNALSIPEERFIVPYEDKDDIILCVGRLHLQKDHRTLLKAFAHIHEDHPQWRLIIAGTGFLKNELEALAKSLSIDKKTAFPGYIQNPYPQYAQAKIFALPSRYEGTPNGLLEAMSCGVAAIISDAIHGGLEFITNPAQIFKVGDAEDLGQKLHNLIIDISAQKEAGKNGAEAVKVLQSPDTLETWDKLL